MSLRQSRCSSQASPNQVISCAPALGHAVPGGFTGQLVERARGVGDDKDIEPSSIAASAGNATQTSVTTPAMISCFLPVALIALTKSSLSQALIWPGRANKGASGNNA